MEKLNEFKGGLLQIIAEEMIVERIESLFDITYKQPSMNSSQKNNHVKEETKCWIQNSR